MTKTALILAGGLGTRLRGVIGDNPKPLVPVFGVPLLEIQLNILEKSGYTDVFILCFYKSEVIKKFLAGLRLVLKVSVVVEDFPRGTGGAVLSALPLIKDDDFLVLYGDTYFDVDLTAFERAHHESSADLTLFAHPNSHPYDSDILLLNDEANVVGVSKPPHVNSVKNIVNAAMYFCNRGSLVRTLNNKFLNQQNDFAREVILYLIESGLIVKPYISVEYIKDLGTPERLAKVEQDIKHGVVERLSNYKKRVGVFIDRDGVIVDNKEYLNDVSDINLTPLAANGIKKLNDNGILAICITNQPVIARGGLTLDGLSKIHNHIDKVLGAEGAYLDALYFCPHHPDSGYIGEVKKLKINCSCRKPNVGMFVNAIRDYNLDCNRLWMIGDTTTDILAGELIGAATVQLQLGLSGSDKKFNIKPYFEFDNLFSATESIAQIEMLYDHIMGKICNGDIRIIFIGGNARVGKSTLSDLIYGRLRNIGYEVKLVRQDFWLRSYEIRSKIKCVKDRYDMNNFLNYIDTVRNGCIADSSQIFIVEGVLAIAALDRESEHEIGVYVDCDEAQRKRRFIEYYKARGSTPEQLESLYKDRVDEECIFVSEYKKNANFVVELK